jgi:hypothetical protein
VGALLGGGASKACAGREARWPPARGATSSLTPHPCIPPPELDRPDQKPEAIKGLPGILARAIGRDIESVYAGSNKGVLADVDLLQRITEASRACVREFVRDRTGGWRGPPGLLVCLGLGRVG